MSERTVSEAVCDELVAASEVGTVEVSLKEETPSWDSSAETALEESETTVEAAGETASIEDAGGSVTDDSDSEDTVDEGSTELVEEAEGSALTVTTLGGPTAATTSPRIGATMSIIIQSHLAPGLTEV